MKMPSDPRLQALLTRRSTPSRLLGAPGPDDADFEALVDAALCVPDHGRLRPWRLLQIRQPAGSALGHALVRIREQRGEHLEDAVREKDLHRFDAAPRVLVVIFAPHRGHKIPEIEQQHSGAALAMNLLHAAKAVGYGAQWLTGWPAHDRDVAAILGLSENESIIGFIHLGTPLGAAPEVERPSSAQLLTEWHGE